MSGLVQVYLWDGKEYDLTSYGHVALELSDGTYISWWPKDKTKALRAIEGEALKNLQEDINYEGGKAPRTITLLHLDVTEMRRWWRSFLADPKGPEWDATANNCSTVAFHCLCEGNSFFKNYCRAVWTPTKLEDVIKIYQEKQQGGPKAPKVKIVGI